jgi:hypothetical protein
MVTSYYNTYILADLYMPILDLNIDAKMKKLFSKFGKQNRLFSPIHG